MEEKAGKTRAELAENTPIGPRAGKAAAAAGAAAVAKSAIRSSPTATPIAEAQQNAPAAHDYTATEKGEKNDCNARPWGRRAVILVSESCILVDYTGHSASFLRDSAVYLEK